MQLIGIVGVLLFLALSTCHAGCFNKPVSNIRAIESALDLYYIHCGRYPESLALMLKENVATGLNCLKSTLTRIPIDPWGNPFRVEINNSFPVVLSAGPDMRYGTEDDVRGIDEMKRAFKFECSDSLESWWQIYLEELFFIFIVLLAIGGISIARRAV